jgi:hypothetical protein
MGKLLGCMDPRVGAAAASSADRLPQEGTERFIQHLLHRNRIGLHLPPMVAGTIIGESDKIPHGAKIRQLGQTGTSPTT